MIYPQRDLVFFCFFQPTNFGSQNRPKTEYWSHFCISFGFYLCFSFFSFCCMGNNDALPLPTTCLIRQRLKLLTIGQLEHLKTIYHWDSAPTTPKRSKAEAYNDIRNRNMNESDLWAWKRNERKSVQRRMKKEHFFSRLFCFVFGWNGKN